MVNMEKVIAINSKEECTQAIKQIGEDLIEKAESITRDIEGVYSITIKATLNPAEIVNFDITKNYTAGLKGNN